MEVPFFTSYWPRSTVEYTLPPMAVMSGAKVKLGATPPGGEGADLPANGGGHNALLSRNRQLFGPGSSHGLTVSLADGDGGNIAGNSLPPGRLWCHRS